MSIERRKLSGITFNPTYTVEVTGTGSNNYCYITVNEQKITSVTSLNLSKGTEITLYATTNRISTPGSITINTTVVASGQPAIYNYTITGNCVIELSLNGVSTVYGRIHVKEN